MIERSYGWYIGSDGLDPLLRSLEATAPPKKTDELKFPVLSDETRKMLLDMTRRSIRRRIANRFGAKAGTRPGTFALRRLQEAGKTGSGRRIHRPIIALTSTQAGYGGYPQRPRTRLSEGRRSYAPAARMSTSWMLASAGSSIRRRVVSPPRRGDMSGPAASKPPRRHASVASPMRSAGTPLRNSDAT